MKPYPFNLLRAAEEREDIDQALAERPFKDFYDSLRESAPYYQPSAELKTAIHTAIAVGSPLLITGDSGTGKTQAAYYTAWRLGLDWPLEFQVRSTSQGRDLLYNFDSVRYFRDAWVAGLGRGAEGGPTPPLDKWSYIQRGKLWQAIATKDRQPLARVKILLIDEIDKAPKDFPNDLLLELDELRFEVEELETDNEVSSTKAMRPIVFITSNSERRLPEPFLRRCVYHHITFTPDTLKAAVEQRIRQGQLPALENEGSKGFVDISREKFIEVRSAVRQKLPSTGEYLAWLQLVLTQFGPDATKLRVPVSELPLLNLLVKDRDDWKLLRS
jgi:MoxR-like ATPase